MDKDGTMKFSNKPEKLATLEKIFDRYYTVRNARKSSGIVAIDCQTIDRFM